MFNSRDTPPPPLSHSSSLSDQTNSREVTPFTTTTSVTTASTSPLRRSVDHSETHPWFQKISTAKTTTRLSVIDPDFDENTFPTFGASPTEQSMAVDAATNNFSVRQTSTSPRGNQPSGLTAALKNESANTSTVQTPRMEAPRPSLAVPESSDMSRIENGSRPISVKGRPNTFNRRESLAQSMGMGMGMSWGGVSVGSWVRDE